MSGHRFRVAAGAPDGGQFVSTSRAETGTSLQAVPDSPDLFGPHGSHVVALLDRVAVLTEEQKVALVGQAPAVSTNELGAPVILCPGADTVRYLGLIRYRGLTRDPRSSPRLRPLAGQVDAALGATDRVVRGLSRASAEAVRDSVVATVLRGRVHAVAYETLTRAVRLSLGRIHPDDGPVHR